VIRAIASAAALFLSGLVLAGPALADWSGDGNPDLVAVNSDGALLMYRTHGAGVFAAGGGVQIGSGWSGFTAVFTPGDWNGDGHPDVLARQSDGTLLLYRGDGDGGWITGNGEPIGSGWSGFTALLAPGDFTGGGKPDLLARASDGTLYLYRGGSGNGGFAGPGQPISAGWGPYTTLFASRDFSGDGEPDVLGIDANGAMLMWTGNGAGGFAGNATQIGSGWGSFTAVFGGGDFDGDHKDDVLARDSNGALLLYRGNGSGGFAGPAQQVGAGWSTLGPIMLFSDPPPPPPPAAPPSAPVPDGRVKLTAGIRCTPPNGRLKVSLRIRKRHGHARPRVSRVVFFVHNGPKRVDRKPPYVAHLKLKRAAGSRGRVYARVVYRRKGSKKLHRKTVSRRFVICG
jgi:hypothetical protein